MRFTYKVQDITGREWDAWTDRFVEVRGSSRDGIDLVSAYIGKYGWPRADEWRDPHAPGATLEAIPVGDGVYRLWSGTRGGFVLGPAFGVIQAKS